MVIQPRFTYPILHVDTHPYTEKNDDFHQYSSGRAVDIVQRFIDNDREPKTSCKPDTFSTSTAGEYSDGDGDGEEEQEENAPTSPHATKRRRPEVKHNPSRQITNMHIRQKQVPISKHNPVLTERRRRRSTSRTHEPTMATRMAPRELDTNIPGFGMDCQPVQTSASSICPMRDIGELGNTDISSPPPDFITPNPDLSFYIPAFDTLPQILHEEPRNPPGLPGLSSFSEGEASHLRDLYYAFGNEGLEPHQEGYSPQSHAGCESDPRLNTMTMTHMYSTNEASTELLHDDENRSESNRHPGPNTSFQWPMYDNLPSQSQGVGGERANEGNPTYNWTNTGLFVEMSNLRHSPSPPQNM